MHAELGGSDLNVLSHGGKYGCGHAALRVAWWQHAVGGRTGAWPWVGRAGRGGCRLTRTEAALKAAAAGADEAARLQGGSGWSRAMVSTKPSSLSRGAREGSIEARRQLVDLERDLPRLSYVGAVEGQGSQARGRR